MLSDRNFLPVTFNLPADLPELKKIVEGGGVLNLVPKPIGNIQHNFIQKMAWREKHVRLSFAGLSFKFKIEYI